MRINIPSPASQLGSQRIWVNLIFISLAALTFVLAVFRPDEALGAFKGTMDSHEQAGVASRESSDRNFLGGSSDILIVKPEDAQIVALSANALLEIIIEPSVYQVFWDGVLDGAYEYLSINDCRFFVAYSPHSHSIYAYDWLGLQYLVSPRALDSSVP